ncbi:MAG: hypothetical protein AAF547_03260 [Actinomycetota bacterium]
MPAALESSAAWLVFGYLQVVAAGSARVVQEIVFTSVSAPVVDEVDATRQTITLLVVSLVAIAVLLAVLTVWYWHYTSPKRRARELLIDLDGMGRTDGDGPMAMPAAGGPADGSAPAPGKAAVRGNAAEPGPTESVDGPIVVPVAPAATRPAVRPARVVPSSTRIDIPSRSPAHAARSAADRAMAGVNADRAAAIVESVRRSDGGGPTDGDRSVPVAPVTVPSSSAPVQPGPTPVVRDEVAAARARRADPPAGQPAGEGLSDDDWAAVMRSAFDRLDR